MSWRIARVEVAGGRCFLARLEPDGTVVPIVAESGTPGFDPLRYALAVGLDLGRVPAVAPPLGLDRARLLAPVRAPQKLLAVGLNYLDHAAESAMEMPAAPLVFAKTTNAITGPEEPIRVGADGAAQVDFEAELAVVVGRRARGVTASDALSHVLGYTACNDVSARDVQLADGQWMRGKSFDTFAPLGPWITPASAIGDPQALRVRCRVNGDSVQDGSTADMAFGVAELIAYLSRTMTLEPGDVIATGTPPGVGFARTPPRFLRPGDVVEVEVDGVGTLRNPVAA